MYAPHWISFINISGRASRSLNLKVKNKYLNYYLALKKNILDLYVHVRGEKKAFKAFQVAKIGQVPSASLSEHAFLIYVNSANIHF